MWLQHAFVSFVLVWSLAFSLPSSLLAGTIDDLQSISVTIKAGKGEGSGVLFSRDGVTFIWTAGHVVADLRKVREVTDATGKTKTVVEFDDVQIVQEYQQDGRRVGEIKMEARVVKYSPAENGEDLALLLVRKKGFSQASAKFALGDEVPVIGLELYHVGSLLGQFGANSVTLGIISQTGRVLDGVVYDQTTVTAFPGSSGGGVFRRDNGEYVGMIVRGAGEQFNLIVPIRRMKAYAIKNNLLWALDPSVPMPSAEVPIE